MFEGRSKRCGVQVVELDICRTNQVGVGNSIFASQGEGYNGHSGLDTCYSSRDLVEIAAGVIACQRTPFLSGTRQMEKVITERISMPDSSSY